MLTRQGTVKIRTPDFDKSLSWTAAVVRRYVEVERKRNRKQAKP
jgi:hypothetical protein